MDISLLFIAAYDNDVWARASVRWENSLIVLVFILHFIYFKFCASMHSDQLAVETEEWKCDSTFPYPVPSSLETLQF